MEPRQGDTVESPRLLQSLGALAKNAFGLLLSRIELASVELGEARDHLLRLLLLGALGVVAILFALACWTALAIVLAWDTLGWKVLLLAAAIYTLLALGILLYARSMLAERRLSLPATMSELRKDRDALL